MSEADGTLVRMGSGAMFDAIAGRYDLLNRILSLGIDQRWRARAVRALGRIGDGLVLDVATGTGDLALRIADAWPKARVVGIDPSRGMLDVGVQKVAARRLSDRVTLEVGDAQALAQADASVDGITIAFGIRNVPDRPRALAEFARVLRPGARLVILELSEPGSGLLGTFAKVHVHHVVPFIGSLLSGSREYRYLQTSIAAFPKAEAFAERLREAGLRVVEVTPLTFGVAHLYVAERPGGAT